VRGLERIRGEALANLGRADEAAAAFRREIDAFPDELAAYSRLAVLYALAGETEQTQRTLQGMVEANPSPTAYAEAARTLRVLGDPASAERLLAYARTRWPDSPELVRDGSETPNQRGTMRR
jgi:tetratricopeptide (TPR) repeat protein